MTDHAYDRDIDRVRNTPDPITRAIHAHELANEHQRRITELSAIRLAAIEAAHDRGLTYAEIARRLGLTPGRISQLRKQR